MSRTIDAGVSDQATGSWLAQMMLSEEYCDLYFSCDGEIFKVHKVVVCPQSSVIRDTVSTDFLESEIGVLDMDAYTPELVQRFRQFLYTNVYDATTCDIEDGVALPADDATADIGSSAANSAMSTSRESSKKSSLNREAMAQDPIYRTILDHASMMEIGDYYDVPDLVKFARAQISDALAGASADAPWVAGLPYIAEDALDIISDDDLERTFATAVSENIGTIIAMRTLKVSPLVTSFCLEVLKKCSTTNRVLSEELLSKTKALDELCMKYKAALDEIRQLSLGREY